MDRDRNVEIGTFWLGRKIKAIHSFLPDGLFLTLGQLEHLPAYLLPILIVALEVGADIGDDLSGLVFLNEAYDTQDVEYLRDEVFKVEIFLLVHESLHHVLYAAFGHCLLLVDQAVEDTSEKLPWQNLRTQRSSLAIDSSLFVKDLALQGGITFELLQLADEASESHVDEVFCRDTEDESEGFEVEDDVKGLLGILEDLTALVGESADLKDGVLLVVHELKEAFDECTQFFTRRDDVTLLHDASQSTIIYKYCPHSLDIGTAKSRLIRNDAHSKLLINN